MKALVGACDRVREFPPGHFYLSDEAEKGFQRYYEPQWAQEGFVPAEPYDPPRLRAALEAAVHRQLMCDVPYGVLLSGGLDSSSSPRSPRGSPATASRRTTGARRGGRACTRSRSASRARPISAAARQVAEAHRHRAPRVHVHGAGRPRRAARRHLPHRDVRHHHRPRVDADVPAWRGTSARWGSRWCCRAKAPTRSSAATSTSTRRRTARELHEETVRKLQTLHLYDCLRANKSMAAWGVEARVPFLDREFLDVAMRWTRRPRCRGMQRTAAASRSTCSAQAFDGLSARRRSCGGRRSSSPTASATLDRLAEGRRRTRGQRRHDARGRRALPGQDAGDQGSVLLPADLRAALPERHRGQLRAAREERRVQHADGPQVGRGVRADGRPVRAGGDGRPPGWLQAGVGPRRRIAGSARP